jgi:hypothetical protein
MPDGRRTILSRRSRDQELKADIKLIDADWQADIAQMKARYRATIETLLARVKELEKASDRRHLRSHGREGSDDWPNGGG